MDFVRIASTLCCAIATQSASAAWINIDELNADDLQPGSSGVHFGQSVAADVRADGSIRALYVGAPNATVFVNNVARAGAGKVYVLMRSGGHWQVVGTLQAPTPQADAHFGAAVAVHRGSIAIGAPDYDTASHPGVGMVHFFQDAHWNSPTLQLPAFVDFGSRTSSTDDCRIGASVAVAGDGVNTSHAGNPSSEGSYFAYGAPRAVGAGCAFVTRLGATFNVNSADQESLGVACSANAGDALGSSVAIRPLGDGQAMLIAGAPGAVQNGNALAGAAYAYVRANDDWLLIDTLSPPNPTLFDFFGTSVAIDAGRVYVGATGRDLAGVGRTGSVSLFKPASLLGYDFERELFPTAPRAPGDLCGASVGLDLSGANGFVMGCPGADGDVTNQGVARVYRSIVFMGNPVWFNEIAALDAAPHGADDLGRSVLLVDDRVYAGAPLANDAVGADNGAVFEFGSGVVDDLFANSFE